VRKEREGGRKEEGRKKGISKIKQVSHIDNMKLLVMSTAHGYC
jgi:hypothetical protein